PHMAYVRTQVFLDSTEISSAREMGFHRVGEGYFGAMGMRALEGRVFGTVSAAANEIVVSKEMAQRLAPRGSALGLCLRLERRTAACRTVVGVVNDVRDMRLDGPALPSYYTLSSVDDEWQSGLIVRTRTPNLVRAAQGAAARLSTTRFAVESYA